MEVLIIMNDNVNKLKRLFYVENCDIQDISECNFDHFLDMIDEYTVTDII